MPNHQAPQIITIQSQKGSIASNGQIPIQIPQISQQITQKMMPQSHFCPKMHTLHLFKSTGKVNCAKCSAPCKCQCWGCMGCNYYECIKCQPYPRFHCPYN